MTSRPLGWVDREETARPVLRALTVVLWAAIVLHVALLVIELAAGVPLYAGSLLAIAICLMALWLLRD